MMRRYFFWTGLAALVGIALAYSLNELGRTAYFYFLAGQAETAYVNPPSSEVATPPHSSVEAPTIPLFGKVLWADLSTMKLGWYENGVLVKWAPILAKGKKGTPWETPPGRYEVLAKNEKSFSALDKIWLPEEIKFSSAGAIHGWPLSSAGQLMPGTFAGGSIRLAEGDAQAVFAFADVGTVVLVSDTATDTGVVIKHYEPKVSLRSPVVSAKSYLLADLESGEVLEAKNPAAIYPIASVSKLMTALVTLEHLSPEKIVTISARAIATEGDSGKLRVGEKIEVSNLLYPLLLASSNDAAEALAEAAGRETFLTWMNDKAKALDLTHTSFEDPSGLSPHNVSTAEDLFKLARYIYNHQPFIFELSAKLGHTTVNHNWFNTNDLAAAAYFLGGKNGYTDEARQTMVSLWSIPFSATENRRLALIELSSGDRKTDAETLLKSIRQVVSYLPTILSHPTLLTSQSKEKPTNLTLDFVGDIMLSRGVAASVAKHGGDYGWLFQNVGELKKSDILFGNLEGPLSDQGKEVGNKYSFRMAPAALPALVAAGFDVLSLANNHIGDWGAAALSDTLARLNRVGLLAVGAGDNYDVASQVKIINKNGYRVGFLAASDVGPAWLKAGKKEPGLILASDPRWPELIKQAASQVDVLVVSYHFGDEYVSVPTERQRYLAQLAIDNGARVVVGHHPHVVQTVEKYKNGLIAYSLGNFIFDQYFSPETMSGLWLRVRFEGNELAEARGVYTKLNADYQPSLEIKDES